MSTSTKSPGPDYLVKPVAGGVVYLEVWGGRVKESFAQFELLNSEALVVPIGELIRGRREAGAVLESARGSEGRGNKQDSGE